LSSIVIEYYVRRVHDIAVSCGINCDTDSTTGYFLPSTFFSSQNIEATWYFLVSNDPDMTIDTNTNVIGLDVLYLPVYFDTAELS
jgi:hypothetical protein